MIVVKHTSTLATPAGIQFASGALGVGLAFAFTCPAIGAASAGALGDGLRYANDPPAAAWRGAFAGLAVLAAASIVYPFLVPHSFSGWPMLGFALLGLIVNAACVLAALPQRLSALHPFSARASSGGYALLGAWGALALARPEGWVCVASVAVTALVLAAERLLGRRAGR